jgi:hypothetical protein
VVVHRDRDADVVGRVVANDFEEAGKAFGNGYREQLAVFKRFNLE